MADNVFQHFQIDELSDEQYSSSPGSAVAPNMPSSPASCEGQNNDSGHEDVIFTFDESSEKQEQSEERKSQEPEDEDELLFYTCRSQEMSPKEDELRKQIEQAQNEKGSSKSLTVKPNMEMPEPEEPGWEDFPLDCEDEMTEQESE